MHISVSTNALQKQKSVPNVKSQTISEVFAKAGYSMKAKVFPLRMKKITSTSLNLLTLELIQYKSQ